MSEVISFRLNPDNPREARALEILRTKQAEGFATRRVLTDALIYIEDDCGFSFNDFNETLERVSDMLERFNGDNQYRGQAPSKKVATLNDHFLNSVAVAVKPGLRSKL